jgi:hypothetical protein
MRDPLMPPTTTPPPPRARARDTVEAARTTAVTLNFTSRPTRYVDGTSVPPYDYDNRTPVFTLTQRVAYDNAPSTLAAPVHSEPPA